MASSPQSQEKVQSFASFGPEQMQTDICNILLMEVRKHNQLFDHTLNMKAIGLEEVSQMAFWDYSLNAIELEMTFSDVKTTEFAKAMLDNYDFGFNAVTGTRSEPMDYDSLHTWFGAYLLGLNGSPYVWEHDGWGNSDIKDGIRRCLYTMQLSNARLVLEGNEPFYHFSQSDKKNDESASEGELTISQLAMLAGMEEMSLRSHISRKNVPILEIRKQDRRTIVDAKVGRDWLIAKGRYLPVKVGRRTTDLDLSITQFRDINDLKEALRDRLGVINDRAPGAKDRFLAMLQAHEREDMYELTFDDYGNADLMAAIAQVLELPPKLLILRAEETKLKSEITMRTLELEQVKERLKEASHKKAETNQQDSGELE